MNEWRDTMLRRVCGVSPAEVSLPEPSIRFQDVSRGCRQHCTLHARYQVYLSAGVGSAERTSSLFHLAVEMMKDRAKARRHYYDTPTFYVQATLGEMYAESITRQLIKEHTAHPPSGQLSRAEPLLLLASIYTKSLRRVSAYREQRSITQPCKEERQLTVATVLVLLEALVRSEGADHIVVRQRAAAQFNTFIRAFCVAGLGKVGLRRVTVRTGNIGMEGDSSSEESESEASERTSSPQRGKLAPRQSTQLSAVLCGNASQRVRSRFYIKWLSFLQSRRRKNRDKAATNMKLCALLTTDSERRQRGRFYLKWTAFPTQRHHLNLCERCDLIVSEEAADRSDLSTDASVSMECILSQCALQEAMLRLVGRRSVHPTTPDTHAFLNTMHTAVSDEAASCASEYPESKLSDISCGIGIGIGIGVDAGHPNAAAEMRRVLQESRMQEAGIMRGLSGVDIQREGKSCSVATSPMHKEAIFKGDDGNLTPSVAGALSESESVSRVVLTSASWREWKSLEATSAALSVMCRRRGLGGAVYPQRTALRADRNKARSIQLLPVAS